MLEIENQLRTYGEAVEHAALVVPLDTSLADEEPGVVGETGRSRTPILVALAACAVLLVGGVVAIGQGRSESVDAAGGASAAQVTAEWEGYSVPAYITEAVPAGMTVSATMSAADYDVPLWTMHSQLYWVDGKTVPDETDQQLVISWFADDGSDSGLYGEPVTIRGTEGTAREDVVSFVDDGFQVLLTSTTFSTNELIAFAERLTIAETGVQPLDEVSGGLTALPVRTSSSYEQHAATVPFDGHTVSYLDGDRELNIFTSPVDGKEQAFEWRGDTRRIEVDGRQVWISTQTDHPPASVSAVWVEDDVQIAVLALGLTEEEVLAVIAASRPASKTEW